MSERRQAFRRDPIEIELEADRLISVGPSLWEIRNEIGNAIIKQHTDELNDAVKTFIAEDSEVPQLQVRLANKLADPFVIMQMALPEPEYSKVVDRKIYPNQITAILVAILEVNELEHLRALVDPNFSTPDGIGGIASLLTRTEDDVTQKTGSGPVSSPGASPETQSGTSPTQN